MAIGAITMILANVGLQIYNNWCGSRQNADLQKKREEFERAAKDRNTEHMWKILREGQELTMQLEKERHEDRLKELKNELDNLLEELTHEQTICNWPLKVLPIVMKNQAFGNLLANQEESVAMHILFARSNYKEFNKLVYPIIEKTLEAHCNTHWSTKSDHPVLFYSGAWDTQRCPMNPSDIQITALRTQLCNLPTLLIIPFFRPNDANDGKLVFQIYTWGVGASKVDMFEVKEIEPKSDEFHFQYEYTNKDDYENTRGLLDWIVEDLVPYIECMIGYMVDTYFWSSSGLAPHLPLLVTNGTINTDGMKYLINDSREYYNQLLLTSEENAKENPFMQENLLNLYEGSAELWDENTKYKKLESAFLTYVNSRNGLSLLTVKDALNPYLFAKEDIPFIETSLSQFAGSEYEVELTSIKKVLDEVNFDYNILETTDIETLKKESEEGNAVASYRLGEMYEYSIGVMWNESLSNLYYQGAEQAGFLLGILRNDIGLYEKYEEAVDYLFNIGNPQSLIIKCNWLCSQNQFIKALNMLNENKSDHPAILFKKVMLTLNTEGKTTDVLNVLRICADSGYVKAIELLLRDYKEAPLFNHNPQLYFLYAQKGMLQFSPFSTYSLSMCFLEGFGVNQSTSTAIEYLRKAIDLGSKEALELNNILSKFQKL